MTFKELAEFILSQPEEVQEAEASFGNIDNDEFCSLSCNNVKIAVITDKTFAPMIFGLPVAYYAILTSDDEIEKTYDHFLDF